VVAMKVANRSASSFVLRFSPKKETVCTTSSGQWSAHVSVATPNYI
jgi:hypothetical protein